MRKPRQLFVPYRPPTPARSVDGLRQPHPAEIAAVHSWTKFRSEVDLGPTANGFQYIYRGQAIWNWNLVPTIYRNGSKYLGRDAQRRVLDIFLNETLPRFVEVINGLGDGTLLHSAKSQLQRSAVAQHYGVPTPLLDWSSSPLIAAFMAYWFASFRTDENPVRIFRLDLLSLPRTVRRPRIQFLPDNRRAYLQQGTFTCIVKNKVEYDFEVGYLDDGRQEDPASYLSILDLEFSPQIRAGVLNEMRAMNLTVAHLFPDNPEFLARELREDILERLQRSFR